MLPKIEHKKDALHKALKHLLKYTDTLEPSVLRAKKGAEWSAAQVLYHLWLSEKNTVKALKKRLDNLDARKEKAGLSATLRAYALHRALKNKRLKFKAPSIVADIPEKPDYTVLKSDYRTTRDELYKVLALFDRETAGIAVFKHPRAGKINIFQTLDFLQDHLDRHTGQIMRITKDL